MRTLFSIAGLAVLPVLLHACSTVRPPERFPGLSGENMPETSMGLVREADDLYVGSIDDQYLTQYDVNIIAYKTYRQHLLPPGKHTLAVFYRQQRNLETLAAGPRYITMQVEAGRDYVLKSNLNGADVQFVDALRTANWRPAVVDVRTNQTVAIAPINQ